MQFYNYSCVLLHGELSNVEQLLDTSEINTLKKAKERSDTFTIVWAALKVLIRALQAAGGESY